MGGVPPQVPASQLRFGRPWWAISDGRYWASSSAYPFRPCPQSRYTRWRLCDEPRYPGTVEATVNIDLHQHAAPPPGATLSAGLVFQAPLSTRIGEPP